MTLPELAIDTTSIVIKGAFDPTKLSPQELVTQGLLTTTDLSQATQKFSASNISILETNAIRLLISNDTIQLTAQQADEFALIRDLAVNILRWLRDEPVGVIGINRDAHFTTDTNDEWHAVGDALTPKGIWQGVLNQVGMSSLTLQAARPDLYLGYQQVTVQPSNLVTQGIFVSHNDHYTLETTDKPLSSRDQLISIAKQPITPTREKTPIAIRILNEEWNKSMSRAEAVIERVAGEAQT